jgi:hypothetical protein
MYEFTCRNCGATIQVRYLREIRAVCSFCSEKLKNKNNSEANMNGACIFQPEAINCDRRTCTTCGWNPVVAKARLEEFKEKCNATL